MTCGLSVILSALYLKELRRREESPLYGGGSKLNSCEAIFLELITLSISVMLSL